MNPMPILKVRYISGSGYNLDDHRRRELAGGEVVEKKQRARTLDQNVVDAVIDQIASDGVVLAHQNGDLEFGADAIDTGDQHRVLEATQASQGEHAAETADVGHHSRSEGTADMFAHTLDGFIGRIDVYPRVAIGDSFV
jgi:hypothetical protein